MFPIVFARVKNIIENSNRNNISTYILKSQGCTISEISKNLNINRGNVKYHIGKLETNNQITSMKINKFKRFFKNMGAEKIIKNKKFLPTPLMIC
ncbi:MAG: winged helix-turn-helix transcriptional regulator [Methanosarcinaceae archaeon]